MSCRCKVKMFINVLLCKFERQMQSCNGKCARRLLCRTNDNSKTKKKYTKYKSKIHFQAHISLEISLHKL